jgi:hypothetical protein
MFREVTNFSYRRTALQAFGWYLVFLLIGGLVVLAAAITIDGRTGIAAWHSAVSTGRLAIIPYHVIIGILLCWRRPKDVANILLLSAGIMLSPLFGALGGLIPFAVLTTRPMLEESEAGAAA